MYEDVVSQTNMSFEQESFIRARNEKVDLNGIGFTLNVNAQYMINKLLTISGGPRYIYRYLFLSNDKISGYPRVSHSNDIGIVVNFGIVINGKNAH